MHLQKKFSKNKLISRSIFVLLFAFCNIALSMDFNDENAVKQAFLVSAESGRMDWVQYFVENQKVDLGSVIKRSIFDDDVTLGDSALSKSIRANQDEVAMYLLRYIDIEKGLVSLDGGDEFFGTPLEVASCKGNIPLMTRMIDLGADVNGKGDGSYTPLHIAVNGVHSSAVLLLMDNGANLNSRDNTDEDNPTPLELAARNGNTRIVREFLRRGGININSGTESSDDERRPPLVHAAESSQTVGIVELLLEAGADINAASFQDGHTALSVGSEKNDIPLLKKIFELRENDLTYSIKLGALRTAALFGNKEAVLILIENDTDFNGVLNVRNPRFNSVLSCAAGQGNTEMVKLLLSRGAVLPKESAMSAKASKLIQESVSSFQDHQSAVGIYLDKTIHTRDLHPVVLGMLYGSREGLTMGKRLQEYRKTQESRRPRKKLRRI